MFSRGLEANSGGFQAFLSDLHISIMFCNFCNSFCGLQYVGPSLNLELKKNLYPGPSLGLDFPPILTWTWTMSIELVPSLDLEVGGRWRSSLERSLFRAGGTED